MVTAALLVPEAWSKPLNSAALRTGWYIQKSGIFRDYTFNAFIVFPEAMASHSPVAVEYPEFIDIP
jgi:hypothetical protein